jgi:hypothetical protein
MHQSFKYKVSIRKLNIVICLNDGELYEFTYGIREDLTKVTEITLMSTPYVTRLIYKWQGKEQNINN